jgi:hypothetical protein
VEKSYAAFWNDMYELGGNVRMVSMGVPPGIKLVGGAKVSENGILYLQPEQRGGDRLEEFVNQPDSVK